MEQASSSLELRHAATERISEVVVPRRRLFAIDGLGPPEASGFELASRALRSAAAAVGGAMARAGVVPPPRAAYEALWWPGPDVPPEALVETFADRRRWYWEQLLAVPEAATDAQAEAAIDLARRGAGRERALIRLVELTEGLSAQLLAIGGPASEAEALGRLLEHAANAGHAPRGRIHVIQLTSPDLVPIDRRRVIVRIPLTLA